MFKVMRIELSDVQILASNVVLVVRFVNFGPKFWLEFSFESTMK